MRWSKALIPTLKETPADAVAPSHVLLIRAGMIRQLGAGAYTYLPLGLRVLHKAAQIVREEMDAAGAIELLMPALQPIEIWKESGRFETFGDLLMKLTISGGHQMCLGPTHEEVITDLVRDLINSYKQLPITMYQVQTKFRDEPRPRFGIVRTREFMMKDAYSFDADVAQLGKSYDAMYEAYCRIFDRCGLPYVIVEAESGPIGGDASHEFMVPCSTGEDRVIQCPACGYAANQERAEVGADHIRRPIPIRPRRRTRLCPRPASGRSARSAIFSRLRNRHRASCWSTWATASPWPFSCGATTRLTRPRSGVRSECPPWFLPTLRASRRRPEPRWDSSDRSNIKIPMILDPAIPALATVVVGGNEVDVHLVGVVPGRDFSTDRVYDLRNAEAGDPCPRCKTALENRAGLEIGHVFKLGTKYSKAMGATYLDDKGIEIALIMGCYGIGINRIMAAAIEAGHDDQRHPLADGSGAYQVRSSRSR